MAMRRVMVSLPKQVEEIQVAKGVNELQIEFKVPQRSAVQVSMFNSKQQALPSWEGPEIPARDFGHISIEIHKKNRQKQGTLARERSTLCQQEGVRPAQGQQTRTCRVCLIDKENMMVAVPCGHIDVCADCQPNIIPHRVQGLQCVLCRTRVEGFYRVYL